MSPRSIAAMLCLMSLSTAHHWSSSQDEAPRQSEDRDYVLDPGLGTEVEVAEMAAAHKRSGGMRLCGDKLTESLKIICNYKYNKRNRLQADGVAASWSELRAAVEPWRRRPQALSMLVRPRARRGVADECCAKSCSIRELSSYCQD